MPGKLSSVELEKIIQPLPPAERTTLRQQELSGQWLMDNIDKCRRCMKRDLWVGIPWFVAYTAALFTTGISKLTIGIFVPGMVYFIYTVFTTGSYGLNRKKVKVYEQLLDKLKN